MDRQILETIHFSKRVDGQIMRGHVIVTKDGAAFTSPEVSELVESSPDSRELAIKRAITLGYFQSGGRTFG